MSEGASVHGVDQGLLNGTSSDTLLLAQALEHGLSAQTDQAREAALGAAPESARDELRALIRTGRTLQRSSTTVVAPDEFRRAARARLMAHVRSDQQAVEPTMARRGITMLPTARPSFLQVATPWLRRAAAIAVALGVAGASALNVSASALPGDTLYGLKQVAEAAAFQLARDEDERRHVLLRQADARIEETSRLVLGGRNADAVDTANRYEALVARLTQDLVDRESEETLSGELIFRLGEHQRLLEAVADRAPEASQLGLERALEVSGRGLERAAEVHLERSTTAASRALRNRGRGAEQGAIQQDEASKRGERPAFVPPPANAPSPVDSTIASEVDESSKREPSATVEERRSNPGSESVREEAVPANRGGSNVPPGQENVDARATPASREPAPNVLPGQGPERPRGPDPTATTNAPRSKTIEVPGTAPPGRNSGEGSRGVPGEESQPGGRGR